MIRILDNFSESCGKVLSEIPKNKQYWYDCDTVEEALQLIRDTKGLLQFCSSIRDSIFHTLKSPIIYKGIELSMYKEYDNHLYLIFTAYITYIGKLN